MGYDNEKMISSLLTVMVGMIAAFLTGMCAIYFYCEMEWLLGITQTLFFILNIVTIVINYQDCKNKAKIIDEKLHLTKVDEND